MPNSSTLPTPVELIGEQLEGERLAFPTGTIIFGQGEPVQFIYAVEQGLIELSSDRGGRLRYGAGELFSYEDLVDSSETHHWNAFTLTPVELIRLERGCFLALIHKHPTLVLALLSRQHGRLREQRHDACHFY